MTPRCRVCENQLKKEFDALVLGQHTVAYFSCESCGLVQTEKPYWLAEAYTQAIASADTGLVSRNISLSRTLQALLCFIFDRNAKYVDMAGGTGLLTRLMRDRGFDFYWHDPFCENIHARGFDSKSNAPGLRYEAITAFEVLEHLEDPIKFISDALTDTGADTLLFTTELYQGAPRRPEDWWYYAPEEGQHISFYQKRTLEQIAQRLSLHLHTSRGFHMLTKRQVSPALYRFLVSRLGNKFARTVAQFPESKMMQDHSKMLARLRNTSGDV